MKVIDSSDVDLVIKVINSHVQKNSTLCMKNWQIYTNSRNKCNTLKSSFKFVDLKENSQLNSIWSNVKFQINSKKITDQQAIQDYLDEVTWKQLNGNNPEKIYSNLLNAIAKHFQRNSNSQQSLPNVTTKYDSDQDIEIEEIEEKTTKNHWSEFTKEPTSNEKIHDSDDTLRVIQFFQEKKVITDKPICKCKTVMVKLAFFQRLGDKYHWKCQNIKCQKTVSIRNNSFFSNISVSLIICNKSMFCWSEGLDSNEASIKTGFYF